MDERTRTFGPRNSARTGGIARTYFFLGRPYALMILWTSQDRTARALAGTSGASHAFGERGDRGGFPFLGEGIHVVQNARDVQEYLDALGGLRDSLDVLG